MVSEAKKHAAEDRRRKELVEARNTADQLAYTAEKALRDLGDGRGGDGRGGDGRGGDGRGGDGRGGVHLRPSDRDRIEKKIAEVREAARGEDLNRIRRVSEELQQASYALSQPMYAAGQSEGATSGNGHGAGQGEGDVVEGEFTEA